MPIIRSNHYFDGHFTQVPNVWLRDERLSYRARGVLASLMSHQPGWQLSIDGLAGQGMEGRDAIRAAIRELEGLGYLERSQEKQAGRFSESVWVTKDPSGLPGAGKPSAENPRAENPTTKNNNIKENQVKEDNQEIEVSFLEFWEAYPKRIDKGAARRAFKAAIKKYQVSEIIAGAIAYRDDPQREPKFTKYPATWLNAEAWLNQVGDEAAERAAARREKELQHTAKMLEEMQGTYVPVPKCSHGQNPARCKECLRSIN